MQSASRTLYQAPGELRTADQFVCWCEEDRDGDITKVPYSVHGGRASSTNPKTWAPFEAAIAYAEEHSMPGVGFVFTEDDPYAGIDLDKCRDAKTGEIDQWARKIVDALDSYTEVSPSGTGLHIFVKATLPGRNNRKGPVEMYESRRYFTLTGEHLDGTPTEIHERQDVLERLYRHVFKDEKPADETNGYRSSRTASLDVGDEDLIALAMQATTPATSRERTSRYVLYSPSGPMATPRGWTTCSGSPACTATSGTATTTGSGPLTRSSRVGRSSISPARRSPQTATARGLRRLQVNPLRRRTTSCATGG